MEWYVEAVYRDSGKETRFKAQADSEAEILRRCAEKGLLVSKAVPVPLAEQSKLPAAEPLNNYAVIVDGVSAIGVFATILNIIGGIAIVLGLGAFFMTASQGGLPFGILVGGATIIQGILILLLGSVLKMLGAVSMAVREIALSTRR